LTRTLCKKVAGHSVWCVNWKLLLYIVGDSCGSGGQNIKLCPIDHTDPPIGVPLALTFYADGLTNKG